VPSPFGSLYAELTLDEIDVVPLQADHLAAP
jgi:hypothetical protein